MQKKIVYKKADIIRELSSIIDGQTIESIKTILNALETITEKHLLEADIEHSVQIKLFGGLSIKSWIVSEQKLVFGQPTTVNNYLRTKAILTHCYKRKLYDQSKKIERGEIYDNTN